MSTVTPNLGLFKYNTTSDANSAFNINKALNNNWDIIDEALAGGCGSSRNIGEIVASSLPLVDAGLHLLDGALINGSGIYSDFVTYIADLYGDGTDVPYYFCSESDWQTSVTEFGACDKFVYSSTNNTVRLPKRTEEHGKLIDSYSSGTNWYRIYEDGWCEQGGYDTSRSESTIMLLKQLQTPYSIFCQKGIGGSVYPICVINQTSSSFKADFGYGGDKSNGWWQACGYMDISDYQLSEKYEYIVIATSTKTSIQVDIDTIATDLNYKVDKRDLHEVQCVIETYTNGSSGYRIWSDGYCEQWGRYTIAANTWTTVGLLKTYKDLNYNVLACEYNHQSADDWGAQQGAQPLTTSSIRLATGLDGSVITTWQTWGYIEV